MKVVSYNVLAQRYSKADDNIYTQWDYRINNINIYLSEMDSDIVCLQEVELATFQTDYTNLMNKYDSLAHMVSKKRTSPIGNVIFWKKDKYSDIMRKTTSCSVIITLKNLLTEKIITIANVHLKAGRECGDTRYNQLAPVMKDKPDIICGDFNDEFESESKIVGLVKDHNYTITNTQLTCCAREDDNTISYVCYDNILSKNHKISLEKCKDIQGLIIPDENNFSDHIPICFILIDLR
jgi:mRNA deadenylase 3'-5' endonuclease subunit Ccr4